MGHVKNRFLSLWTSAEPFLGGFGKKPIFFRVWLTCSHHSVMNNSCPCLSFSLVSFVVCFYPIFSRSSLSDHHPASFRYIKSYIWFYIVMNSISKVLIFFVFASILKNDKCACWRSLYYYFFSSHIICDIFFYLFLLTKTIDVPIDHYTILDVCKV